MLFHVAPVAQIAWAPCDARTLPDGSKVWITSGTTGAGTEVFAARAFPDDRGAIAMAGYDFHAFGTDTLPTAAQVLQPSPWTTAKMAAAISDPALVPALPTDAVTAAPTGFLSARDLGTGFVFDTRSAHAYTGELQLDNGCAPDHSVFNLAAGRTARYTGQAPGGVAVAVDEGEYILPQGTGASTFVQAHTLAQPGCDIQEARFSQDSAWSLPAGIGDGAFVENQVGTRTVRILIRFGDTVLDTQFTAVDLTKPIDLSSGTDRAWLTDVARRIATRWTAGH